jgi:hypothetical protein
MGNGLFLALALSGGGLSPGALEALMMMRQRNYEKLCLFIKWLASTLVYGYYWLKKHPAVVDKPDDYESKLWTSLIQHPSQSAQTNQLLQGLLQPVASAAQPNLLQLIQQLGMQQGGAGAPQPVNNAPLGSAANPVIRPRGGNL